MDTSAPHIADLTELRMSSRRGHGEGGIRKRADGRWEGQVDLGWIDGKRRRVFVYGRTRAQAVEKLRDKQRELESGAGPSDGRLTVDGWITHWLENVLPGTVKATTAANYSNLAARHLRPTIGRHRLAKLEPRHVEALMAAMADQGYRPNTIRLVRSVLRRSLGHAVRQGLIIRNVAALTDGPRVPKPEVRPLAIGEVRSLLQSARGDRLEVGVVLLVETGMRVGELLGLRWSDVDLDQRRLRITQTLSTLRGKIVLDQPKTASSRRPYALSRQAVDALRTHRSRQAVERLAAGAHWVGSDHVVATQLGGPLDPSNFRRRFGKVAEAAGIRDCHPHQLRHTAASLMLSRGVQLHVVADVLGHSSISVTKDVYGHLLEGDRELASEAMASLLYKA